MLRKPEHLGASWRAAAAGGVQADSTYAWSRRLGPGHVGIDLALFLEYEELVVVLRPAALRAA
jgi:hypothetical protein